MSEKKRKPKVPDGQTRFLKTRQRKADKKGFVGYDTIWESFQKEVKYKTPTRP